jgi:hypothetical protein
VAAIGKDWRPVRRCTTLSHHAVASPVGAKGGSPWPRSALSLLLSWWRRDTRDAADRASGCGGLAADAFSSFVWLR